MTTLDWDTFEHWSHREASETFEFLTAAQANEAFFTKVCRLVTSLLNKSGGTVVISPQDPYLCEQCQNDLIYCFDTQIIPRPNIEIALASTQHKKGTYSTKYFLVIDVPVGTEKPYSFENAILIRIEQSIRQANRAEILEMIGEHEDPDLRWERQLLPSASESDLDEEHIRKCLNHDEIGVALRRWANSNKEGRMSDRTMLLRYFNLTSRRILRNGAVVLFGKQPEAFFPQVAVRAVAYRGEEFESEEILDDKLFTNNMFETIDQCMIFLERHVLNSSYFPTAESRTFQRHAAPTYPFSALREAVLNALVHRDFTSIDTSVVIKVMPSRIEIWNSGSFPKGTNLAKLEDFRVSRPANPDIAYVLQRMGYIERLGSGINRIIKQFQKHDLPRPIWEDVGGGVRVTLRLDTANRLEMDEASKTILNELELGEVLTRRRLGIIGGISGEQLEKALIQLVKLGHLVQIGPDRYQCI